MVLKKRLFDLIVSFLAAVAWAPALLSAALLLLAVEGRPIFYLSSRRVYRDKQMRIIKFRTMVRNAETIVNRDTVPLTDQRFLNLPVSSPVYTRIGRIYERLQLTELPQVLHVLQGRMSLVGNRPLPENVIAALVEVYSDVEGRFLTRGGLTGPIQLVGREFLSDADRLRLEIGYCRAVLASYSWKLDMAVLLYTVVVTVRLKKPFSVAEVEALIRRFTGYTLPPATDHDHTAG